MWCRCAYVMVCELDENRLLAEYVLSLITRLIREHVTLLEQKNAEVRKKQLSLSLLHTLSLPPSLSLSLTHTLSPSLSLPPSLSNSLKILLKAEKTAAILHYFLPNGQLLFMNHKLISQYERQLERTLTAK